MHELADKFELAHSTESTILKDQSNPVRRSLTPSLSINQSICPDMVFLVFPEVTFCRILGSHSDSYEEFCLLEYNAVESIER
jgi:hypothetical protein